MCEAPTQRLAQDPYGRVLSRGGGPIRVTLAARAIDHHVLILTLVLLGAYSYLTADL